jgi:UDP-3-O-[3-hydroxymyristoyl] glucosamine N-acyltransferase
MQHPGFFERAGPFPLRLIATRLGAELDSFPDLSSDIEDVRPLGDAGPQHLAFFDNPKYLEQLSKTGRCLSRGSVICRPRANAHRGPEDQDAL